jgi:quercetin dioxygenase-like cupin family protein
MQSQLKLSDFISSHISNTIIGTCDRPARIIFSNEYLVAIALLNFMPGTIVEKHSHEELCITFLQTGKLKFSFEANEVIISRGEIITILPHTSHSLEVISDTPVRIGEVKIFKKQESTGLNRTPDSRLMFSATTKKSFIIEDPKETCNSLEEAINLAFNGRPGPVHIHVPKDITISEVPDYRPVKLVIDKIQAPNEETDRTVEVISNSILITRKIIVIIGYGAVRSHTGKELLAFIEKFNIPFTQTMDAKGFLRENHPLCLGVFGSSGDQAFMQFNNPDFVKFAEACGADGYRVEKLDDFAPVLQKAIASNKPVLIDMVVDSDIYPPSKMDSI